MLESVALNTTPGFVIPMESLLPIVVTTLVFVIIGLIAC